MLRVMRFQLTRMLAAAALTAATLATAISGQLPAQASYGPLVPVSPAPGGYVNVVTSRTVGSAGGVIGPVTVNGCRLYLRVLRGTFSERVQITITAPNGQIIATGHPRYRALCGAGVLVQANGTAYTGRFGKRLVLRLSARRITARARVAKWKHSRFVFVRSRRSGHTEVVRFRGADWDFAVLVPAASGPGPHTTAAVRRGRSGEAVLTSVFITPVSHSPAGIGVLAPAWLAAAGH